MREPPKREKREKETVRDKTQRENVLLKLLNSRRKRPSFHFPLVLTSGAFAHAHNTVVSIEGKGERKMDFVVEREDYAQRKIPGGCRGMKEK